MAGGQFMRFGGYPHMSKSGKRTAQQVLAEALRQDGYAGHVKHNHGQILEPRILVGSEKLVLESVEASRTTRVNAAGHRIRFDTPVLIGLIISFPRRIDAERRGQEDLFGDEEEMRNYEAWKRRALKWLDRIYGARLRLAVEHLDEGNPHLHALLVPDPYEKFNTINPAEWGGKTQKKSGKGRRDQDKECIRLFHDSFYADVSHPSGHGRGGGAGSKKRTQVRPNSEVNGQQCADIKKQPILVATETPLKDLDTLAKWVLEDIRKKGEQKILDEMKAWCLANGVRIPSPEEGLVSIQTNFGLSR